MKLYMKGNNKSRMYSSINNILVKDNKEKLLMSTTSWIIIISIFLCYLSYNVYTFKWSVLIYFYLFFMNLTI
jgi:hypothetical protein